MNKRILSIVLSAVFVLGAGVAFPARAADIQVEVDGRTLVFDQAPIMENDRVLVPIRALAEALGASVSWYGTSQRVTAIKGTDILSLQIGNNIMKKNARTVWLDVAPKIVGDRTLVPVRAVSEGYDAQVDWDGAAQKVIVKTELSSVGGGQPDQDQNQSQSSFAYRVFELTNQERVKAGLLPLEWSDSLAAVALAHSKDMAIRGFFDHTNPDGLSPFDRMKNAGISYRRAAENIAAGQQSPEAVVNGWMNSSGHRANILNPQLTHLGVGYYAGGSYGSYWTQCFITP